MVRVDFIKNLKLISRLLDPYKTMVKMHRANQDNYYSNVFINGIKKGNGSEN